LTVMFGRDFRLWKRRRPDAQRICRSTEKIDLTGVNAGTNSVITHTSITTVTNGTGEPVVGRYLGHRSTTWSEKTPEGRWRPLDYDELLKLLKRDKLLDIFWLREQEFANS